MFFLCIVIPGFARSYETDFHFGLTYWLARQARFTGAQAHEIARGNERTDTGVLDAKHAIAWKVCVGQLIASDDTLTTASDQIRELHFRSEKSAPGEPREREVRPATVYALQQVNAVLAAQGADLQSRLHDFGRALHGVQDTYSHQGRPGIPPVCPSEWAWAHPAARGGPLSHRADLTYRHIDDCTEAANVTYRLLQDLHLKLGGMAGPLWGELERDVRGFCAARTRAEKSAWLVSRSVPQAIAIVQNLSIPKGTRQVMPPAQLALHSEMGDRYPPQRQDPLQERLVSRIYEQLDSARPPREADAWFEQFFSSWLGSDPYAMSRVVKDYVDPSCTVWGKQAAGEARSLDFLLSWRIDGDHREEPTTFRAADWLKGGPATSVDILRADDWRRFLVPDRRERPYLLAVVPRSQRGEVAAIVIPKHAPYDVLVFVASRRANGYAITRMESIVMH